MSTGTCTPPKHDILRRRSGCTIGEKPKTDKSSAVLTPGTSILLRIFRDHKGWDTGTHDIAVGSHVKDLYLRSAGHCRSIRCAVDKL